MAEAAGAATRRVAPAAPGTATSAAGRLAAALLGLTCAAVAAWLALHHPLSPLLALAGVGLLAATLGPLRRHPLAPALVAAVIGTWVVGGVDSVLDMPRVATWLLLLTGMALALHLPSRARQPGGRP